MVVLLFFYFLFRRVYNMVIIRGEVKENSVEGVEMWFC